MLSFLKAGFDNGEAVWVMFDERQISREEIRSRIKSEWKVRDLGMREANGEIIITTSQDWFSPGGKFDSERIRSKWQQATSRALALGKTGFRAFGAPDELINSATAEFIDYEHSVGTSFDIPFTGFCAYMASDIANAMTPEQLSRLYVSHGRHRISGYDVLENPMAGQHVALTYENTAQREAAITKYINAGLKKNQLCVYASIYLRNSSHRERMMGLFDNSQENVDRGNLVFIDLAPHYIASLTSDIRPFESDMARLRDRVSGRQDKHIRFVGDCDSFLFQNRHFDECMAIENWLSDRPLEESSCLCPYPLQLLDKFPYDIHKVRMFVSHDVIADHTGRITTAYLRSDGRHQH